MKKILTILGARPQFIKASVVSKHLMQQDGIVEKIVHTGQHYDSNMTAIFFEELGIPTPHFNLNIGSGSHAKQTGDMLLPIENICLAEKPDWVVVYGDTNSTLAGALTAAKLNIPIAHIEAGLRSFNKAMPEEINRIVTDRLSSVLFTPTDEATQQLKREGYADNTIRQVGDVMLDVALHYGDIAESKSDILHTLSLMPKEYVLTTIHRAENTNDPIRLKNIFDALIELSSSMKIICPLHPRTKKYLKAHYADNLNDLNRIQLIEPVGFLDMVMLEKNASMIATDSGGVQKEAFFHQVPCVTLRDETEWVELLSLGWNVLQPPQTKEAIVKTMLAQQGKKGKLGVHPYGQGRAHEAIVDCLMNTLG